MIGPIHAIVRMESSGDEVRGFRADEDAMNLSLTRFSDPVTHENLRLIVKPLRNGLHVALYRQPPEYPIALGAWFLAPCRAPLPDLAVKAAQ